MNKSLQREYNDGYYTAMEDVLKFLNSLDTSEMTVKQVRSKISSFCIEARPKKE